MSQPAVLTVIGARPQFIKAAMVSRALASHGGIREIVLHTGQHFDYNMSAIFFDELAIQAPKYNLGIGGGSHAVNTGGAMEGIEKVIDAECPALVTVYGDTDSTLAAALAAAKMSVPVAHVEAGLRSFNRRMPEEINRIVTDHLASLLFAPSQTAVNNLAHEGIPDGRVDGPQVRLVGDVMYDAVKTFGAIAEQRSTALERFGLRRREYVLATLHRKENTDDSNRLARILEGLSTNDGPVILPLHPRTRKRIAEAGLTLDPTIRVIDPVGYLDMLVLQRNARLIATDSGGVQKEAYFHAVPCVTLRDETEWVELVEIGVNRVVGSDIAAITAALSEHTFGAGRADVYGTGDTANVIAECLVQAAQDMA